MSEPALDLVMKLLLGISLGAILGSFITMLAYRVPRRLSIVQPGSFCPSCRTPLQPRDLVPLASYLAYGGRCRMCRAPIGLRYFFIELFSTFAIALIIFIGGIAFISLLYVFLFVALFSALLMLLRL